MPKSVYAIVSLLLLLALGIAPGARADWMNLTGAETAPNIAEITVLDDRVRVVLEVYIGDLATFEALLPDDWLKKDVTARPPPAERLKRFSAETFQVVTGDGTKLQADLKLAEPRLRKDRASPFAGMINPMTRRRVPDAPKDKRVLYAELEYPFEGKPETLTFIPPRDEKGITAVTIGFIAYHKAVPIIDFRYLSGGARVKLDWADPWYTKFDNPNLKRHHKSALMSFLYVAPREVRHEILARIRDLQEWTDLGLAGGATIEPDEQAALKDRVRAFFVARNPLKVDGVLSEPASSRAEFLTISLTGLQVVEEAEPLDLSTAIVGVILSYPVKHLPKHVSVDWELFNDRIERIPATVIDPVGPLASFIEARDPTLEWQNFLKKYQEPEVSPVVFDYGRVIGVPVLSMALLIFCLASAALAVRPRFGSRRGWATLSALGAVAAVLSIRVLVVDVKNPFAGPPDEATSAQIVTRVLNNVNHAFIEKEPEALRRALGVVVAEDMLGDIETELQRALAIKVVGGGIARVNAIENLVVKDITALNDASGFRLLAEWTAKASAGHWGHAHRRTIRFRALMELAEVEGVWKLIGLTVVDAKQQT
ncbi:MAG: hypothetical protein IH878_12185 [Gemmatimonadetes bacterium]|nr:hypothetical protein [Gemmatimonadota bacterium]